MKKVKGIAAFAAAVMILNSATVVFAADKRENGTKGIGRFEGKVDAPTAFRVVLPTISEEDADGYSSALKFILDPNGLISGTGGERYGKAFDPGSTEEYPDLNSNYAGTKGLYFPNTGTYYDYSGKSDILKASNVGTTQVDISVKATLSNYGDITLVDVNDEDFEWSNDEAELYMAITKKVDSNPAPAAISVENNVASAKIGERLDSAEGGNNGTLKWTEEQGYHYEGATAGTPVDYEFYVEGQVGGDWSAIDDASPALDLKWVLKEVTADANPGATATANISAENNVITLNYGGGQCEADGLTGLQFINTQKPRLNNLEFIDTASQNYNATYVIFNAESGEITFTPEFITALKNEGITIGTLTVTFNNEKVTDGAATPTITDGPTTAVINVNIS